MNHNIDPATSQQLARLLPVNVAEGQTDLSNARRFALAHHSRAKFCKGIGWLVWNGRRWAQNDGGAEQLAKDIADWIWSQAGGSSDIRRFAMRAASATGIRGMVSLARTEAGIVASADDFNGDPFLLNVYNGTLDLRTKTLREHRPADMQTQLCLTPYKPEEVSSTWLKFLHSVFQSDRNLVEYVNRILGYCLTGDVREQVMPIFHGDGANGKSTLVNAVLDVLGPDYAMQAVAEMLMETKQTRHRTERFDLLGKRFVSAAETGHGGWLNVPLVKQLTGGERVRANKMHHDNIEFWPTHKIVLSTNYLPRIRGNDHAIWRRLPCVPFRRRFDGEERDGALPDKLRSEAVGILTHLVDGCQRWQGQDLHTAQPAAVIKASEAYRLDENVLERFVRDCCTVQASGRMQFSDFYHRLSGFCDSDRSIVPSRREAGQWLKQHFQEQASNGRWYAGITLNA